MEFTVLGIKRKAGEYEGRSYDNTYLHCSYFDDKMDEGVAVTTVKVKTDYIDEPISVGDKVRFFYDRYGNAVQVDIL